MNVRLGLWLRLCDDYVMVVLLLMIMVMAIAMRTILLTVRVVITITIKVLVMAMASDMITGIVSLWLSTYALRYQQKYSSSFVIQGNI